MGASKSDLFTQQQNDLAAIARVLAHPARIAILQYLAERNACIGGEIVEVIPLAQPTISRHLKELKLAGLIQGTVEGNRVNYCIHPRRWREVQHLLENFFSYSINDRDCC